MRPPEVLQAALYDLLAAQQTSPSLWGYRNGTVYRFLCNGLTPAASHGYPTDEKPPTYVLRQWLGQGTITPAEYNRLRRRPGRGY